MTKNILIGLLLFANLVSFEYGRQVQAASDKKYLDAADVVVQRTLTSILSASRMLKDVKEQLKHTGCGI